MARPSARDPEHVKRTERIARRRAERSRNDMRWVLSDERGRRVLWTLLENAGIFRSSFTGNSETFFKEGERNVGLRLLAHINDADMAKYLVMAQEARELEDAEKRELDNQGEDDSDD